MLAQAVAALLDGSAEAKIAVATGFGAMAIVCYFVLYILDGGESTPPSIGFWPYIGAAVSFGKDPINFLLRCKQKYGPVFTLYIAGRNMTFLTDVKLFKVFFESKAEIVSFEEAVQPFTQRAFGIPSKAFYEHHHKLLTISRKQMSPIQMKLHSERLAQEFDKLFSLYCSEESSNGDTFDLLVWVRTIIFEASLPCLYGDQFASKNPNLQHWFWELESQFEYASGPVPHMFLSRFTTGKKELERALKDLVDKHYSELNDRNTDKGTVAEALINSVPRKIAPQFLLTFLWAAEANSTQAAFWAVVHMLQNPHTIECVRKEVRDSLAINGGEFSYDVVQRLVYTRRCVKEALRLHSPGIAIRRVKSPLDVEGYTIPAGHDIAICPQLLSHPSENASSNIWKNPQEFKPDRFEELEKPSFSQSSLSNANSSHEATDRFKFLPFGHGMYRCPGMNFALQETVMFLAMLWHRFDLKLVEKIPTPDTRKLVGIQHCEESCFVAIYVREDGTI